MKTSRRILLLMTVFLLLVFAQNSVCMAAMTPEISVNSGAAVPGETVDVSVLLENNPGILGATLTITYDEDMELISAENGTAFSPLTLTLPGKFGTSCNFVWYAQSISKSQIKDGEILKLRFKVSDSAQPGKDAAISVSYQKDDIFDDNLMSVSCATSAGKIRILQPEPSVVCNAAMVIKNKIKVQYDCSGIVRDAVVFLAGYTSDGKMSYCASNKTDLFDGKNEVSFDIADPSLNYEVFTTKNAHPLCGTKSATRGYTVRFVDYNDTLLSEQYVAQGANAVPPSAPTRSGYVFTGWSGAYSNIQKDTTVTAQYEENSDPTIIVGTVAAHPGETVTSTVQIRNNPGILGMTLKLEYDPTVMQLIDCSAGTALDKLNFTPPGRYKNNCIFTWYAEQLGESDVKDGEILHLTYRISDMAPKGTYALKLSFEDGDIFDRQLQIPSIAVENGTVQIS